MRADKEPLGIPVNCIMVKCNASPGKKPVCPDVHLRIRGASPSLVRLLPENKGQELAGLMDRFTVRLGDRDVGEYVEYFKITNRWSLQEHRLVIYLRAQDNGVAESVTPCP